jgi:hypothetical protein
LFPLNWSQWILITPCFCLIFICDPGWYPILSAKDCRKRSPFCQKIDAHEKIFYFIPEASSFFAR